MAEDFEERKRRAYIGRRSIMDYGMGIIIGGFGLFFAFADRLGYDFDLDRGLRYALAGLFLVYGIFRIYRGYKKDYFKS